MDTLHELAEEIKANIYWKIQELEELDKEMDKLKTLSEKLEEVIDVLYEHGFRVDNNMNRDDPEFCIEISHNDNRNRKHIQVSKT